MMKLAVLFSLLGASAAFTTQSSARSTTALSAETPFGAAPMPGGKSIFLGKTEWEKFTKEVGTEETGTFLRAA